MFRPPRCPNTDCSQHRDPEGRFYRKNGSYPVKCRAHRVPRFICRTCKRGFSRQTFRADYRDHRPDVNVPFFKLLNSGIGLRQCARVLGLSFRCTELKFRKLARHLRSLNLNLRGPLPDGCRLQFDELETYEGRRNTRPLTVPVLIEPVSRATIWAESATIRPRGKKTPARLRAIAWEEAEFGPRQDHSRRSCLRAFRRGAALTKGLSLVRFESDEKSTYPYLVKRAFKGVAVHHQRTNSQLPRNTWNPLFPINHTEAMARDLMGRLRRESWLVSKEGKFLDLQLQLYIAYRNYARPRFNGETKSPAELLGWTRQLLTPGQLLGWRQDWGPRSLHPLASGSEIPAALRSRAGAA